MGKTRMPDKKKSPKRRRNTEGQTSEETNINISNIRNSKINIANRDIINIKVEGHDANLPEVLENIASETRLSEIDACLIEYIQGILRRPNIVGIDKGRIYLHAMHDSRRLRLEDLLATSNRLVLTGSPGSGKTVFLLQTLKTYCEKINAALSNKVRLDLPVPVYVELGMLVQKARYREATLDPSRLIQEETLRLFGIRPGLHTKSIFLEVVKRYKLLLLLDGLNEVPPDLREKITTSIVSLDADLGAIGGECVSVLVTSRIYGFVDWFSRFGFQVAEISPLSIDEIDAEFHKRLDTLNWGQGFSIQSIDPKTRQLLSTPQHLDYYLNWYQKQLESGDLASITRKMNRTKANILCSFCEQKLTGFPPQKTLIINQILGKLGYQCVTRSLYFTSLDALNIINDVILEIKVGNEPNQLLDDILVSGLLVRSGDQLRFAHHSIQQYYAACCMVNEMDFEKYIDFEIWHEPLVIMAGLLDAQQLRTLLKRVRLRTALYAHILSNVDEPDLERAFIQDLVKKFVDLTWNWRGRLIKTLVVYFVIWFTLLPVLGISLMISSNTTQQVLFTVLGAVYVALLPVGLIILHKQRTKVQVARLINTALPQMLVPLKLLMAKGALQVIQDQLIKMRSSIRDYQSDDTGSILINAGIEKIKEAINIPAFMGTDEMLAYIGDPLFVALIEPSQLTTKGFNILSTIAIDYGNDVEALEALNLLGTIFQNDPESRIIISDILERILEDKGYSKRRKARAIEICKGLGIVMARKQGLFQNFFASLLRFLSRIFSKQD